MMSVSPSPAKIANPAMSPISSPFKVKMQTPTKQDPKRSQPNTPSKVQNTSGGAGLANASWICNLTPGLHKIDNVSHPTTSQPLQYQDHSNKHHVIGTPLRGLSQYQQSQQMNSPQLNSPYSLCSPKQKNNQPQRPLFGRAIQSKGVPMQDSGDQPVKPPYSFPCLIGLALRTAPTGKMSVSQIYEYVTGRFPFFITAKPGWKNSVRHNLSLNKVFCKFERTPGDDGKGALWGVAPGMQEQLDRDIQQCEQRFPQKIKDAMKKPASWNPQQQRAKAVCRRKQPKQSLANIGKSQSAPAMTSNVFVQQLKDKEKEMQLFEQQQQQTLEQQLQDLPVNQRRFSLPGDVDMFEDISVSDLLQDTEPFLDFGLPSQDINMAGDAFSFVPSMYNALLPDDLLEDFSKTDLTEVFDMKFDDNLYGSTFNDLDLNL
eukprot:m.13940 g.13940  ORF g.13940 m.13940 type:complete len:429 (-) comp4955_c0_seq1:139-1425(-)